jgi:hypothetical protein
MPGLLRGVARTAVVAGTASAVSGRVQRHQAEKFASRDANIYAERQQAYDQQMYQQQPAYQQPAYQPPPPPAAPPAAAAGPDLAQQLQQLADLKNQGILSEEEFHAAKAKLLNA